MTERGRAIASSEWHPRRVVVTGYYDGPTAGVIDLGEDIGIYCFEAVAFDLNRETRVSKLSRVAPQQFESVLTTLSSALGAPRWPFWVPLWSFRGEDARRTAEAELEALCTADETVLAALTDDSLEKCFAIQEIDAHSAPVVSDWLSLFDELR